MNEKWRSLDDYLMNHCILTQCSLSLSLRQDFVLLFMLVLNWSVSTNPPALACWNYSVHHCAHTAYLSFYVVLVSSNPLAYSACELRPLAFMLWASVALEGAYTLFPWIF